MCIRDRSWPSVFLKTSCTCEVWTVPPAAGNDIVVPPLKSIPKVKPRTMMLSLAATGIAPGSFYELDAEGNRQRAHYDGLPCLLYTSRCV